jgi:hypothetical protein
MEARVLGLSGLPKHYHKEREEIFEILEGIFRFQFGDEEFDVGPGTSAVVPRGVPHTWANMGTETARILFTFAPGGIDDFFILIGRTPPEGWVIDMNGVPVLAVVTLMSGCTSKDETVISKDWKETGTIELTTINGEGEQIKANWLGVKERIALSNNTFIAGKTQKYMWLLWGNKEDLVGKVQ